MSNAATLIAQLGLARHREGGWYRETWRAPCEAGNRASGTAIMFLLESGDNSHWHAVDATQIWLWHAGNPLNLRIAPSESGPVSEVRLGPDIAAGDSVQHVVPAHHWQTTHPLSGGHDYTLASCVVSPGFDFAGFTLAPPDWEPGMAGT